MAARKDNPPGARDPSEIRGPGTRDRDFLGCFGVLEERGRILLAANRRRLGGRRLRTWDLPGGQVEDGETLAEALVREFREETGLRVKAGAFLFLQEGRRELGRRRCYVWRSFFFRVRRLGGRLRHGDGVEALCFLARDELSARLRAPYHDAFLRWLATGERFLEGVWRDPAPATRR